ncbi:unnamed protein product [Darwinula stevensoni]|uniref:Uncharacterized protein n=1 Tax=Darwinula stevensoni TaxID=69355 RepID=A0A7R9A1N1_9CRUS|nr:unnamed protein product [Darwinula stevensoni]CAG0886992.1 unnamed protein product [Darwinula stevensoni]
MLGGREDEPLANDGGAAIIGENVSTEPRFQVSHERRFRDGGRGSIHDEGVLIPFQAQSRSKHLNDLSHDSVEPDEERAHLNTSRAIPIPQARVAYKWQV